MTARLHRAPRAVRQELERLDWSTRTATVTMAASRGRPVTTVLDVGTPTELDLVELRIAADRYEFNPEQRFDDETFGSMPRVGRLTSVRLVAR